MVQPHPCGSTHRCIFTCKCTHDARGYEKKYLKVLEFKQVKNKKAHKHSNNLFLIFFLIVG